MLIQDTEFSGSFSCFPLLKYVFYYFRYLPFYWNKSAILDLWAQIMELPLVKGEVMWVIRRKGKRLAKDVYSAKSSSLHFLHSSFLFLKW